jgi:hypothetical protein
MLRLTLAVAAFLGCLSSASASRSRPAEPRLPKAPFHHTLDSLLTEAQKVASALPQPEYMLTEQTEVRLNGRPIKYNDVPESAQIILLEVGSDQKTIRRIHFETKK